MRRASLRTVEIECTLEHETKLAWLIDDGDRSVWIPKSRGKLEGAGRGTYVLTIDQPLAEEKGLV